MPDPTPGPRQNRRAARAFGLWLKGMAEILLVVATFGFVFGPIYPLVLWLGGVWGVVASLAWLAACGVAMFAWDASADHERRGW